MGAVNLTVRNCRFEDIGAGIWTESADSRDFLVSGNLFLGREDPRRLIGWNQAGARTAGIYPSHQLRSFFAIKVYGRGTSLRITPSPIFMMPSTFPPTARQRPKPNYQASSIDIYNNDLHLSNDDFIESDGGSHNIRVYPNRGVNAGHNGYSAQPMFGGLVYFIRNIVYHVPAVGPLKLSVAPAGVLAYHNTMIGEQVAREPSSNIHFGNNLFLGRGYRPNRNVVKQ